MSDCLFCKLARRDVDADIVYDSSETMAFRDISPAAPTHILVIPKRHIRSAQELDPSDGALLGEMFEVMSSIARNQGLDGGYRIVTNIGPDVGQSIDHLHFHLLGGRRMTWPPG